MSSDIETIIKTVRIDDLRPADYNPRKLSETAQEDLKNSLRTLGVIKAIVVRGSDGRIIAGHQRTKTMKLVGINECPAFIIGDVGECDEVRFNQLHNFTEVEVSDDQPIIRVSVPQGTIGFTIVQPKDIEMVNIGGEANKIILLSELLAKYGQFANAVADSKGNIIISAVYAKMIKLQRLPLLVYVLPEGMEQKAVYFFSKKYGEYSYDHIKKNTYIQLVAQPYRMVGTEREYMKSVLYETQVLKRENKQARILDFGAGCKNYYTYLKAKGYNIDAIEFFYCGPTTMNTVIITEQVEKDCREIASHLEKYGRYDAIVCDHVINSVDSMEAEAAVLRTLTALCKPNGTIYWAGNTVVGITKPNTQKRSIAKRGVPVFLDDNRFSGIYRNGVWFFQHYHNIADVYHINKKYIGKKFTVFDKGKEQHIETEFKTTTFEVVSTNEVPSTKEELLEAIRFEFTLPLPKGQRYQLDKIILPVIEKLL